MTTEIALLAVGLVVGGVAVWLILKGRIQVAAVRAKARTEAECAGLSATLRIREAQLQGLNTSLEKTTGESARLQTNLTSESARRAAAEEKNSRIPILEAEVKAKEQELAALNMEVARFKEAQAELNTILEKERQAADEKLALLNDARQKLGDAFKTLSSEALISNNQTFMNLANTALETFRQNAQTDLTARLLAIDDLVKTSKKSLEELNGKIAATEKEPTSTFPESGATLSARNIVGHHSGVPAHWQARCAEASGGKITYTDLGYYLASALRGEVPDDLKEEDWLNEISRLSGLLAAGDEQHAWIWLHEYLPKRMELVPNRWKGGFISGLKKACDDGKLG